MKKYINPNREQWAEIIARPVFDNTSLKEKVSSVLQDVKQNGDDAIKKYTEQFDGVSLENIEVTKEEIDEAVALVSDELKQAIEAAAKNIRAFHEKQTATVEIVETQTGIECWRKSVGIEKVGLYIPGGSAPLFSTVLMLAIPASIAGCSEIVLCSPPNKEGKLHPAILFSAQLVGVTKIFKIGGVQAIGAMTYGTATVPKVYKIFGPGNQYVTCAKQLAQEDGVAIDMPAGPSEVLVLADDSANVSYVASDLLSQAEHGVDSQAILITISQNLFDNIDEEIEKQLNELPRKSIAEKALDNSKIILVKDIEEAVELANYYASEHLILACNNAEIVAEKIINAGSVFIGNYSPESAGDYASGTNHTLPTNGFARAYSGVSVDSFVKKITFQKLSQQGLQQISQTVIAMAEAEGLQAHANAIKLRVKN
ncbi:histidinol dehydrogenase [Arachidicoccus ginsenosidimutans]|uniref:histidinol dehydrogenase n=1 Tax=Arachidicoccus sp. BS20 TaxID=1850526 RepID=UPI0007F0DBAC|nr:histidinol dehydrogenase [Arachidicoccus sp. BS20]ANI90634.1 histidinol dehydrogenase [Arachidicoccus sp. BS20]